MATDTNSAPLTTLALAIIREANGNAAPRAMLGGAFCHQALRAMPAGEAPRRCRDPRTAQMTDSQMGSQRPQTCDAICVT